MMKQMPIEIGYKETWKYGESLNFKHAFKTCILMIKWRDKAMKVLGVSEESLLNPMMIKYFRSKLESDVDKFYRLSYDFKSLSFTLRSKQQIN